MYVKLIPSEELKLKKKKQKNRGVLTGPPCLQIQTISPIPGSPCNSTDGMGTAQEPPGPKNCDPNASDHSLCLVTSRSLVPGDSSSAPHQEFGSTLPSPISSSAPHSCAPRVPAVSNAAFAAATPRTHGPENKPGILLPSTSWIFPAQATLKTGGTNLMPRPRYVPCRCAQLQAQAGHPKQV